jgi:hypothetical protein
MGTLRVRFNNFHHRVHQHADLRLVGRKVEGEHVDLVLHVLRAREVLPAAREDVGGVGVLLGRGRELARQILLKERGLVVRLDVDQYINCFEPL